MHTQFIYEHPLLLIGIAICAMFLWLQTTTYYIAKADRLVIRRSGFVCMEILFDDIEEIEQIAISFDRWRQIRMYQLNWHLQQLRIVKRKGFFRYVVINPRDPTPIIEAFREFRTNLSKRTEIEITKRPPPSWLSAR